MLVNCRKRRQKVKEELQDANAILCNSTKMIREKLSLTEGTVGVICSGWSDL